MDKPYKCITMEKIKNVIIAVCLIIAPLAYHIGKSQGSVTMPGKTITLPVPEPIEIFVPDIIDADLPKFNDTLISQGIINVVPKVDTAAIIRDYIARKTYEPTLYDNMEHGKLKLSLDVQYNTLTRLDYSYIPPNIPKKRWSIGLSAGPVITPKGVTGGIMLGIMYDLWQF